MAARPAVAGDELWAGHSDEWRDPAQVVSQWREAAETDPKLLQSRVRGRFWELLGARGLTLVVSREYEHLLVALSVVDGAPRVSFMRLPHPSGLALDERRALLYVASTRNPNQVYELEPVSWEASGAGRATTPGLPLIPVRSRFLPGSLYLHDLALIGGVLHANAVGHNAVVALPRGGGWRRVWWPRSIERGGEADFSRNYLQLNSIAAGSTLARSYFSASSAEISARRPGHVNYPVDGRGVIFSGATREPLLGGLTRPHSARLQNGRIWVDNSGYGELMSVTDAGLEVAATLPGWTRGLWLGGDIAFVGTSRVIPRFRAYAPGLDVGASVCGVHAVELASGKVLGSLTWPYGNQIFAIEALPAVQSDGFAFTVRRGRPSVPARTRALFSTFTTRRDADTNDG